MTIESAVNNPDDSSVTFTILFDNSTELNVFFLSEMSVSASTFPSSDITSILFVYKHTTILNDIFIYLFVFDLIGWASECSGGDLRGGREPVCWFSRFRGL